MSRKIIMILGAVAVAATVVITIDRADAQLNNKPFTFKNSPAGGSGMSPGGKEAIINDKLFDSRPDNLHRGADGRLIDVIEGPGRSAIAFEHGTANAMPGYKGTGFRGNNDLMRAGVFNAYFGPSHNGNSFTGYTYAQFHSGAIISSWTTQIVSGVGLPPYYGNNPVDSWTAFVNTLDKM